jgi:hypothetical protein
MIWLLGIGLALGGIALVRAFKTGAGLGQVAKTIADNPKTLAASMALQMPGAPTDLVPIGALATLPVPPIEQWQDVEYNGQHFKVSPIYLAPSGIGEAQQLAAERGWVLPTPGLVDAIYKAADLKIAPHPESHDGTEKTMNSVAMNAKHLATIAQQIVDSGKGDTFKLLGGSHKDVVVSAKGELGIYGWHKLDGKPIQGFFSKHAHTWKDYSQGLRPIIQVSA